MNKKIKKTIPILLILFFSFMSGNIYSQAWKRTLKKENPTFSQIREHFYKYWAKKGTVRKKGTWKQFKRWEWFAETRLDSEGYFDPTLNWKGWLEKKQRFGLKNTTTTTTWTQLGPVHLPELYNNYGYPGMGRLNCIAFHPNNPEIIWVGAPSGGLWKTVNGGNTWSSPTDHLPNLGVTSILIHPQNPDIMYLATGDGDGSDTFTIGVLKSPDGGQTWNTTGLQPVLAGRWTIGKLSMHPSDPETLVAALNRGIYKSSDGGNTWSQKVAGDFRDIEVAPSNPSTWYGTASADGIYRSTDSGDNWTRLDTGLPRTGFDRIAAAISPSAPHIIYALYVNLEGGFYGLYRSTDSGNSWTLRANSPNILGWQLDGGDSDGQGFYDLTLAVYPTNPNIVYVGGINLWKSTDGGAGWEVITHWTVNRGRPYVHADHHDFIFHPHDNNTLFSGNDGGLFKSTDGGATWTDLSSGLAIHQIYRLGVSAQEPGKIIIGTQDNGSAFYDQGEWKSVYWADGMECAIDPVDSETMYCSVYNGNFYRSNDSGRNWTFISSEFEDEGAWVTPFLLDPQNPSILYAATSRVFKSTNRGSSWTAISHDLISPNNELRTLAVAPSDSNYIYTADYTRMFVTTNGGGTWSGVDEPIQSRGITAIAIHPQNPRTLWITVGRYQSGKKVFYSTDAGETWTNISGILPNIPANCIVVDPLSYGLYVGTDLGIFYSPSGTSWQSFDNGLPNVIVNELEIHANSNKIRAATFGRGLWESPLAVTPDIFPPINLAGERKINKSFFQIEHLDVLTWQANPFNADKEDEVVNYRIYRVNDGAETLLASVSAGTFEYYVRNIEDSTAENVYCISSLDEAGKESLKTCISVR